MKPSSYRLDALDEIVSNEADHTQLADNDRAEMIGYVQAVYPDGDDPGWSLRSDTYVVTRYMYARQFDSSGTAPKRTSDESRRDQMLERNRDAWRQDS